MLSPPDTEKNVSAKWWRLRVKGVPQLRILDRNDRPAVAVGHGAKVVELRVVRTPLRTEGHVMVKHPERAVSLMSDPQNPVGVDMGLKNRMTLSAGEHIPPGRWAGLLPSAKSPGPRKDPCHAARK